MGNVERLQELHDRLDETIEKYEEFERIEWPRNLRDAVAGDWQLEVSDFASGVHLPYEGEAKRQDRKRVIVARRAVAILLDFEYEVVRDCVTQPIEGVWLKVRRIERMVKLLVEVGAPALAALYGGLRELAGALWEAILKAWIDPETALREALHAVAVFGFVIVSVASLLIMTVMSEVEGAFGLKSFIATVKRVLLIRDKLENKMREKALPQRSQRRWRRRKLATK